MCPYRAILKAVKWLCAGFGQNECVPLCPIIFENSIFFVNFSFPGNGHPHTKRSLRSR